jgi:hypothetical protein
MTSIFKYLSLIFCLLLFVNLLTTLNLIETKKINQDKFSQIKLDSYQPRTISSLALLPLTEDKTNQIFLSLVSLNGQIKTLSRQIKNSTTSPEAKSDTSGAQILKEIRATVDWTAKEEEIEQLRQTGHNPELGEQCGSGTMPREGIGKIIGDVQCCNGCCECDDEDDVCIELSCQKECGTCAYIWDSVTQTCGCACENPTPDYSCN